MIIELVLFIKDQTDSSPNLNDLAFLSHDYHVESENKHIEFVLRLLSTPEQVLELVKRKSNETRNASYIIISDQLIIKDFRTNDYKGSILFESIHDHLKHAKSFCGLIGIFENHVSNSPSLNDISIDQYALFEHKEIQSLRKSLLNVAHRIWLKSPITDMKPHELGSVNSIEIMSISSKEELYECLELRSEVYKRLGYINDNTKNNIETDYFDPVAFHFRAVDKEDNNKIVGTMRLIVPSLPAFKVYKNLMRPDFNWFNEIAERASPISLPVFQSFQHFRKPNNSIPNDTSIRSKNVCEISRVIVSPKYRGMGVSKLLMNHAIMVAKQLKREFIWLECAPHHIDMYKKFGFTVKNHATGYFYERVQRFDTWAVAMYRQLNLDEESVSQINESSATCYYLPITKGRAENCTIRFQYFDKPVEEIKNVFEQPLSSIDPDTPLKELIPSTLMDLNIEQFVLCLKKVFADIEPNKISFIQQNGRNHVFNSGDIKSGNRGEIETHLYQWLG